ncbi:hypothetical protein BU17DRAFT_99741 [Hysterangium stoloniferum]|nr:hypothetical protein BU17DRAFT_99741 [Hysterangium stoloniferum]
MYVPFPTLDFSLPILLAVFSLCTSMLAVLGTVQLVISSPVQHRDQLEAGLGSRLGSNGLVSASPSASKLGSIGMQMQMAIGMALSSSGSQNPFQRKSVTPSGMWWSTTSPGVSPTGPSFTPLEARPPLSMAKLIMLRHADSQRRANQRARARMAQSIYRTASASGLAFIFIPSTLLISRPPLHIIPPHPPKTRLPAFFI